MMRGEKAMEDITFTPPEDGRLYGSDFRSPRRFPGYSGHATSGPTFPEDAGRHAASGGCSGETGTCPDTGSDTAEAQAMPGVVNVVTAKDVKGTNRLVAPQGTVHSLCDGPIARSFVTGGTPVWGRGGRCGGDGPGQGAGRCGAGPGGIRAASRRHDLHGSRCGRGVPYP